MKAVSFTSNLTKILFFLLAFFLAFGSVNPLNLSQVRGVSDAMSEQFSLSPILFLCCSILAVFDKQVFGKLPQMRAFWPLLLILLLSISLGDLFYSSTGLAEEKVFYAKLAIAMFGFITFSLYFTANPRLLRQCLEIYAWTCSIIVVSFFLGFLNPFLFYSNGRLWLFGENPNSFSFLMGFGALSHLCSILENKRFALFRLFAIIAIIIFIVLCGSRGSFIICIFSMGIALVTNSNKHIVVSLLVSIAAIVIIALFLRSRAEDITFFERMGTITEEAERSTLLSQAFSLFTERPLYGFGRHGYLIERFSRFNDFRDSHNMFISILAMGGFLGGISILSFIISLFKRAVKVINKTAIPISFLVYIVLISMKTGDIITYSMMWYIFAIVYSYSAGIRKYPIVFITS